MMSFPLPSLLPLPPLFLLAIAVNAFAFAQAPVPQAPVPPWDVNQDSVVDMLDLLIVVSEFDQAKPQRGDVDGNGVVDIFDLVMVAKNFGKITKRPELPKGLPPPPGLP